MMKIIDDILFHVIIWKNKKSYSMLVSIPWKSIYHFVDKRIKSSLIKTCFASTEALEYFCIDSVVQIYRQGQNVGLLFS